MSDAPDRDLVVAAALLRVRAPEHTDGFWERLEHRLSATELESSRLDALRGALPFGPPTEPEPITVAPTAIARLHRTRQIWRGRAAVLSAAAVLVVIAGAVALLSEDDPGGQVAAPTVASTAPFLPSTTLAIASTTSIGPPEAIDGEPSSEITSVEQWVDAVAMGDTERAWELLGPVSRSRVGGYEGFAALMPELAEGYGALATAVDRGGSMLDLVAHDEGTLVVITLRGQATQEGAPGDQAKPVPVRQSPTGRYRVEPFASVEGEMVDIQSPEPRPDGRAPLRSGESVEAILPARAEVVAVSVDGYPTIQVTAERIGSSDLARLSYTPEGGWTDGVHQVTIAYLCPDGTFGAAAIVLDVTSK